MPVDELLPENQKSDANFDPAKSVLKEGILNATPPELYWRDLYLQHGNAGAAVQIAFANKNWSKSYIKVKAWELKKKFGFDHKSVSEARAQNEPTHLGDPKPAEPKRKTPPRANDIIDYVKTQYNAGEINEEQLFAQMRHLAYRAPSDETKYKAVKELKLWVREIKSEIEAHKLMEKDIIDLLVNALTDLPKAKYMKVLQNVRAYRKRIIKERTVVYNADEVRKTELNRLSTVGGRH